MVERITFRLGECPFQKPARSSEYSQVYSLAHFFEVYRSKHSLLRKMAFTVQAFYNAINLVGCILQ